MNPAHSENAVALAFALVLAIAPNARAELSAEELAKISQNPVGNLINVPFGGGVGKIVHLGKLPVNLLRAGYYNVVRPDFDANWVIQAQVKFMFPK